MVPLLINLSIVFMLSKKVEQSKQLHKCIEGFYDIVKSYDRHQ